MQPDSVLRIEHGIGGIDRGFDHVRRGSQFWTLLDQVLQQSLTVLLLNRIGQTGIGHADQFKNQERRVSTGGYSRAAIEWRALGIGNRGHVFVQPLQGQQIQRSVGQQSRFHADDGPARTDEDVDAAGQP